MVARGNAVWTPSKSGRSCPCQKCSRWPPAEELCWIVPQVPRRTSLLYQRNGNSHGSSMSRTKTASSNPFLTSFSGIGDIVVGRRNAGWTTSVSGRPCPCQNKDLCWIVPHIPPPPDPRTNYLAKGLNWTEPKSFNLAPALVNLPIRRAICITLVCWKWPSFSMYRVSKR